MPDRKIENWKKWLLSVTIVGPWAMAQAPVTPSLTFQAWKDQQVLEAQNQILRASARIAALKSSRSAGSDGKDSNQVAALPSSRVKKASDSDVLGNAEKDLRRAEESMETANTLQFNDYIAIYLPTLQDEPEALNKLTEKLSKEELSEITKSLIRKGSGKPSDAKRSSNSALEGLTVSARNRAP